MKKFCHTVVEKSLFEFLDVDVIELLMDLRVIDVDSIEGKFL